MLDANATSLGSAAGDGETTDADSATSLRIERLNALGLSLAQKRADAISARENSGIEQQWLEDEEFYQGVDDANRDEHRNAWRTKPPGQYTPQVQGTTRSAVFPNITRPYCDAAAARIADMLLPTDDRNWGIRPTPVPELAGIAEGEIPPDIMLQLQAPVGPGMPAPDQQQIDKAVGALAQQAARELDEAKKKADKAQTRIEDWHVECQYHSEVRKVIEDASRCGAGVLKGPHPVKRRTVALMDVKSGAAKPSVLERLVNGIKKMMGHSAMDQVEKALIIKESINPASKRVDFWNFYPDGSCGENIHNGSYVWERDYLTNRQLHDLIGTPGYIKSQIEECIKEGPMRAIAGTKEQPDKYLEDAEDKRYEIWYFHGVVERENLIAAECKVAEDERPIIPAMIAMVNNRVIKAAMNPLDSGDLPYDIFPWQRKSGMPWGNGVARHGRVAQKIVTAGTRHMMDNGGLAAGPQIVIKQGAIVPSDGQYNITPRKLWYWAEDVGGDIDDVRKAMTFFTVPSLQAELQNIIQFGMKLMEDATGLPMLLQGQLGKAPDTVGGMTMLNNNASAVLRRLARTFDDTITEPHIRRYYTWLLQYGEDSEKGDLMIDARGSSALVERDMQSQQMPQLLQASNNVAYGIDPKKTMAELIKSWHLDPKRFAFDDEEWKKIVANLQQKPADPRVEIEQMRLADADKQRAFEAQEGDKDRQNKIAIEMIDERLTTMELTSVERQALEKIKADLSKTAMQLTTQKELSAASMALDVHKHHVPQAAAPAVEPAGRARAGEAFQA